MVSAQRVQQLEACEIASKRDLYGSAAPGAVRACGLATLELDGALAVAAARTNVPALNRLTGLGVFVPATGEAVGRAITFYRSAGSARFFLQLCPTAEPAVLPEVLRQHGLAHHNNWVRLSRHVEPMGEPPSRLRTELIGPGWAERFARICGACYEWPPEVVAWMAGMVGRPRWRHYMAFDGATPVATAAAFANGDRWWIGFAGTLPAYRGSGAQTALIVRRMNDAAALGCAELVAETLEDTAAKPSPSYHNLTRLGFETVYLKANYLLNV